MNSEFDSSFACLTSGTSLTYGGGRGRKGKKHTGPSVSARQREGGSLPSNVNATHNLASLTNLDLIFHKKKSFCEERSVYDWTNKEKSKSLDKPSYGSVTKKEDKDSKEKKDNKRDHPAAGCTNATETEKKSSKVKPPTNEMLEPENTPMDCKPDFMVIDFEVNGLIDKNMVSATTTLACRGVEAGVSVSHIQRARSSLENDDDEGTEMKIIEPRRPMQLISRATFETGQTPVDSAIEFPLREQISKNEKPKIPFNGGGENPGAMQLQTYNNVKCVSNGAMASGQQGKVMGSNLMPIMHVSGTQSNIAMTVSRITGGSMAGRDSTVALDRKSLDENGNAVHGPNGERKKTRRKNSQKPNVIVYSAENVAGHRYEKDIDSLLNFIENKDSKGAKKGKTSGGGGGSSGATVKMSKSSSGEKPRDKPRSRDKDSKRDQLSAKLQKSNSLEEISKTKLEDLTAEKSSSSGASSPSSSQYVAINGGLRRAKQRSAGDDSAAVDSRGDRRSWGTEEGQSIYCNDIGNEYDSPSITRRNSSKKISSEVETQQEPEFLVVTKKKKSKKQRRSSSGDRAQCSSGLASSPSYLPRSRGFANDYRTPHSPELRRKSASSMPPSDKSDSSDLDSVHSLPVTSNTKDNMNNKNTAVATSPSSSSGTPQTSYADITRMATMNLPNVPSSVLNISNMAPAMMNTGSWPLCPGKSPSEPDKFPQDYYPSLDELQSDRKFRQHNFSNSNNVQGFSVSFDNKPSSPTNSKSNISPETQKAEAREEAINKKIQVIKYVQEQKNLNENTNTNANQNDQSPILNALKYKNSTNIIINSADEATSDILLPSKDTNSNKINTYARTARKNISNYQVAEIRDPKKTTSSDHHQEHQEVKPSKTDSKTATNSSILPRVQMESDSPKSSVKCERTAKVPSIDSINTSHVVVVASNPAKPEVTKSSNDSNANKDEQIESKKLNTVKTKETTKSDAQVVTTRKNQRPPVILMDESSSDPTRNMDSSSELTFGFEVNEQLLKSDGKEERPETRTISVPESPQVFDKPPPIFGRPPPLFDKLVRCEEFPPNFQVPPPHIRPGQPPLPHSPINVPPTSYHMAYPPRFHLSGNIYIGAPTVVSSSINEKYQQPKEDFSARYVEPEKAVNVQSYNHDKIVTFVGLAWDAVMREIPVTTTTGRVQYYSGQ